MPGARGARPRGDAGSAGGRRPPSSRRRVLRRWGKRRTQRTQRRHGTSSEASAATTTTLAAAHAVDPPEPPPDCAICMEGLRDAMVLPCGHRFCSECLMAAIQDAGHTRCPTCRHSLRRTLPNNLKQMLTEAQCQVAYAEERANLLTQIKDSQSRIISALEDTIEAMRCAALHRRYRWLRSRALQLQMRHRCDATD